MQSQLITYLRAGYPGLAIITAEEPRAEAEIAAVCNTLNRRLHAWSVSDGLIDTKEGRVSPCPDPLEAFDFIERTFAREDPRLVVVMRDIQLHLDHPDPMLVRRLKDLLRLAKSKGHALILLGCRLKLPSELEHEITSITFALPGAEQLGAVLDGILQSAHLPNQVGPLRQSILQAAFGLTTIEAENAFALSVAEGGGMDPRIIAREKARTLKRIGLVEVIETSMSLDDIGGLDLLKGWLVERADAFTPEAKAYGLPVPKGLLVVGFSGTGKSLTAKASSTAFGMPLLRLDMGRVFGGIVGQSEANLRSVIHTAEAIAPCVLWIDEVEKGFSGSQSSGSTDGGTSSRVFGSFLSWMQEKKKPVFVVATANDVSKLPPEFLRKGRFDEVFFTDLPDQKERVEIWNIVIRKFGRDVTEFDTSALAIACEQYTGAEIEAAFGASLHLAFAQRREPTAEDIQKAMSEIVPLAKLLEGQTAGLKDWMKGRARPAASRISPPRRQTRRVDAN